MDWIKFKKYFHPSWHSALQPFIESEECNKIYEFLKSESKLGKQIAPSSSNVYRCFLETPLNEVRAVLIGSTPFHNFEKGQPIADGLLLGCSITNKLHPKLNNFYLGLEKELYDGFKVDIIKETNVEYLCQQGVLMLNLGLTVAENEEDIHLRLWEPFMQFLFEKILNPLMVPYIFLEEGFNNCEKFLGVLPNVYKFKTPLKKDITQDIWDTEKTFTRVNAVLYHTYNDDIFWLNAEVPF